MSQVEALKMYVFATSFQLEEFLFTQESECEKYLFIDRKDHFWDGAWRP